MQFSVFLDRYEETKNKSSAGAQVQLISGTGSDNLKQKLESIST